MEVECLNDGITYLDGTTSPYPYPAWGGELCVFASAILHAFALRGAPRIELLWRNSCNIWSGQSQNS